MGTVHDPLVVAFKIPRPWPAHHAFNGRRWWPSLVTVWHREPGGADSLTVCRHRYQDRRGRWQYSNWWKLHVHHWHIQIHPLQSLRRWALTRCAWCGGRSRKGDYVNISHSWDGPRGRWWQGEPGVFHQECSYVESAHRLCLCPDGPVIHNGLTYGTCLTCHGFRPYGHEPDEADRLLAALPQGSRITDDIRPRVEAAWRERRAQMEAR